MECSQTKLLKLGILSLALTSCASESLQEIGTYNPNDLISKSLVLCHEKEIPEGKSRLEKVMTNEKANPLYWNALGICYSLENQPLKANFYYELGLEAISLYKGTDKKFAEAALMNNIGLMHLSHMRFSDAYLAFKKAEILIPENFSVQLNQAQLFLEFKYDEKALMVLKKLELDRPGDTEVLYSLALVYSRKNDYERALLSLSKINSESIIRPDISGLFAYNLLETNQLPEALAMIEKRKNLDKYEEYNKRNKFLEKEISAKSKEQQAALKK